MVRASLGVLCSSLLAAVGLLLGQAGCIGEIVTVADESDGLDDPALEGEHRAGATAMLATDCTGEPLPVCEEGWTGPNCNYACDPGARVCAFRYDCHADGRVAGISLSRAHLFRFDRNLEPLAIRDRLEHWISAHEAELDLRDGLTPSMLDLSPADDFQVEQGMLTLYRFHQRLRASPTHPRIPIVGEGALLTVQADRSGAVVLSGTVVDPRAAYAHARTQAPASLARESIARHASLATGVPATDVEVEALQLVAVPWAEQVAWYGVPMAGHVSCGRTIVSADPSATGGLDLLMYDAGEAYALGDRMPITVQTQDSLSDPWGEPWVEVAESTLTNGTALHGSTIGETTALQLATEEVVVIDMRGNDFSSLYDGDTMQWGFERYEGIGNAFSASAPDARFYAQRLYHLVQSGYAIVDRAARGKWDSAVSLYDPSAHSDYVPGTYRPRIIVGNGHASIGHAGQASRFAIQAAPLAVSGFPEAIQWPVPHARNEIIATINTPSGTMDVEVLLHEVGHTLDVFLAPGYPDDHAPEQCPGCPSCSEDTSAEANPLTETIAQMLALWQLRRTFPGIPHDTCDLMLRLSAGTTNNEKKVHSPACMGPGESLALFVRDDDPACPDPQLCDKPSNDEADASMGSPHWCDATEGYHVFSILQAWWNMLHGLYCEPPDAMGVACEESGATWPPGCDQPGSTVECASADEVAGLALLYAIRTNPTSYVQLMDAMAAFVACNYGADAYDAFNQALCDHWVRPCDAPAPLVCQACGNGLRESPEDCDGQDLSVDELGYVPTCEDFGYEGGTLACQGILGASPCHYDFSQCIMSGLDDTGTGAFSSGTSTEASTTTTGDDATGPGSVDGGGANGCGCATNGRSGEGAVVLPLSVLLLLARRGRRRHEWARTRVICAMLGVAACESTEEPSEAPSGSMTSATSDTDTSDEGSSETGAALPGWPEDWHGEYREDVDLQLGQAYEGLYLIPGGLGNLRFDRSTVTIERFGYEVGNELSTWTFALAEHGETALRIVPPDGAWGTPYPGAKEVLVRPGPGCDELVIEAHELPPPYEPVLVTRWSRGRLCVTDPYDDTVCCDEWMVDLCPGTTLGCSN